MAENREPRKYLCFVRIIYAEYIRGCLRSFYERLTLAQEKQSSLCRQRKSLRALLSLGFPGSIFSF